MLSKVTFILILVITLATSWIAAMKVVQNHSQESKAQSKLTSLLSPTPQAKTTIKNSTNSNNKSSLSVLLPTVNTPTTALLPTQTPIPFSAGSCIVTVFGNQYNVTNLRRTHSGGDIFKCGTDMTSVYQSRHSTNTAMIQPYLVSSQVLGVITSGVPSLTNTPFPTATSVVSNTCIVTLFGKNYDVTALRQTHSGGDIFQCGTDMSTIYQSRHETDVSRMQPYLVSSQSTSGTQAPLTPTNQPLPAITLPTLRGGDDDDDDDD